MGRWNHQHILDVAAEKEKYRGSDDLKNLLRLVTESIYSDDIHYALELLQNAEDEGARQVDFRVTPKHVIVYNDGEPFDEDDVEAICSIKTGFKRNKIGFFGIGFKSVFNITDAPQVISGHFNFRIRDCLYPEPVRRTNRKVVEVFPETRMGALFVLPIKRGKTASLLATELETIDDRLLLFLTNIQKITFRDETGEEPREWSISKVPEDGIITITHTLLGRKTRWRVFHREPRVPRDRPGVKHGPKAEVEQTKVVIAFPSPDDGEMPDLNSEFLYCYLPTKRRPDMPFLVQGDFVPTLARENIDESSAWNRWLLEEIAKLASDSYLQLRREPMFRDYLFELIKFPYEVGDPLFRDVAEAILDHLRQQAIAPTNLKADRWRKTSAAVIVPSELRQLLRGRDFEAIYGNRRQHVDSQVGERGLRILARLGVPKVGLSDVIRLLGSTAAMEKKSPGWLLDIYDYLAEQYEMKRLYDTQAEFEMLASVPFLRTSYKQMVAPEDFSSSDRLLSQHPQTKSLGNWVKMFDEGELVFLDRYFQEAKKDRRVKIDQALEEKRKRVKRFLGHYDVAPSLRPYQVIQKVIMPKFASGKYRGYPDDKIVLFTNYVRENLVPYINRMRSQRKSLQSDVAAIADIREILRLKGVYESDGQRHEGFFAPHRLYLGSHGASREPIARAIEGVGGVPYVSAIYLDRTTIRGYTSVPRRGRRQQVVGWDDFFEMLGVWRSPRLEILGPKDLGRSHQGWEWVPKPDKYTKYNRLCEDKVLPDLAPLLEYYSEDPEARHKQVLLFRDLLAGSWEDLYQPQNWCRHEWSYYGSHEETLQETSFLHQLRETEWLPVEGRARQLFRPDQVYVKTPLNALLLLRGTPLIRADDDPAKAFYSAIGVNERPDRRQILEHLRQLRSRWYSDRFPADWPKQMEAIYRNLLMSNKAEREQVEFLEVEAAFQEEALVFLPSTQCNWWRPDQVFWEDRNNVFGDLRGYLGPHYTARLKTMFGHIGVAAIPSISDCLAALDTLKTRWAKADSSDRRLLKGHIDRIYGEVNRLLEMQVGVDVPSADDSTVRDDREELEELLAQPLYLVDGDEGEQPFVAPTDVYYCDDERLRDIVVGEVNLLWLQTDWHSYRTFFEQAKIEPLSSVVAVEAAAEAPVPAPAEEVEFLRGLANYLRPYLKYRHSKEFVQWDKGEALTQLENLDVLTTPALRLEYSLNGEPAHVTPNVSAYYDGLSNRLYVLSHSDWLQAHLDAVSYELARIFEGIGVPLKTQIESLLSVGFDEEARYGKFESFGIPERVARGFIEPIQLKLREGRQKAKTPEPPSEPDPGVTASVKVPVRPEEHTSPRTEIIEHEEDLVSLEDLRGFKGKIDKQQRTVLLQPRSASAPRKPTQMPPTEITPRTIRKSTVSALETEMRAIEMVIEYEQSHKRTAKDVHHIGNLGYDVESTGRYIEIKSFKGNAGQLSLQPSEWSAAERHGQEFYIYVVSNLLQGQTPRLRVIRDPVRYLQVYVPGRRIAKDWQPAISEDMTVVLAEDQEPELEDT